MKNKQIIVLMGMPGSGKSTLAQALGKRLKLAVADLDVLLEKEEGKSVPAIFEQEGEDYFRRRESEILKKVLQTAEPMILATGGGTPCFFDNLAHIKQHAFSVYLDVPWPVLAKRLSGQPGQRPLLKGLSDEAFIESLEQKFGWRIPFYQQANVQLKVEEGQNAEALAELVLARLHHQQ